MKPLKEFYAPLCDIDVHDFIGQPVLSTDFNRVITASRKVNLEGNPPIIYLADGLDCMTELLPHLEALNFSASQRYKLGKNNKSMLFGAVPPAINRSHFCTFGAVADRDSELHALLSDKYSTLLQLLMKTYLPGWSQVNNALYNRKALHTDYQLANTIWTSGIINQNSPHNYHFDGMNVNNMMSGMITLKQNMHGGYLCFPEYQLAFEVKNCSAIFFCGKSILHGVSPMQISNGGYRYTIVYYTTDAVKKL